MEGRRDFEPSLQRELSTRAAVEFAVRDWDFESANDAQNTKFAHLLCLTTLDAFPRLAFAGTELDFAPTELPNSLHGLFIYEHFGEVHYFGEPEIRLKARSNDISIPGKINGITFDEWISQSKTFSEAVGELAYALNDPQNEIEPSSVIRDKTIVLSLENKYSWGIQFIVDENKIDLAVWGNHGQTEAASNYILHEASNIRSLSETVAHLSVLATQYALKADF